MRKENETADYFCTEETVAPYDEAEGADDFYNLSQEEKEKLDKEYQEFLKKEWLPF